MPADLGQFHRHEGQQRVLLLLQKLAGHEAEGLSAQQCADAVGIERGRAHHDLRNLAAAGMAEQLESGRWRLGPKMVQIALDYYASIQRISQQADQLRARYSGNHSSA